MAHTVAHGGGVVLFVDVVVGLGAFVGEHHGLAALIDIKIDDLEGVFVNLVPLHVGGIFHLALEVFYIVYLDVFLGHRLNILCNEGSMEEHECCCESEYLFHIVDINMLIWLFPSGCKYTKIFCITYSA